MATSWVTIVAGAADARHIRHEDIRCTCDKWHESDRICNDVAHDVLCAALMLGSSLELRPMALLRSAFCFCHKCTLLLQAGRR